MHFHQKQNHLFFLRIDLWSILALVLSVTGGVLILILADGHFPWYSAVGVVLLTLVAIASFILALFVSRRAHIDACTSEAFRLSCAETVAVYRIPSEEVSSTCCFLRIYPPKGRHPMRRQGYFSSSYTVSLLLQGEKLIFEIRGVSLISPEIYRKTVRVLLHEVRSVSFEPDSRRGGKRGSVIVTGSDGQILFSCRCRSGHPAQDFIEFIRARIL